MGSLEQTLIERRNKDLYTVIIAYSDGRPDKVYRVGLTEAQIKKVIVDKMTPEERQKCTVIGFGQLRLSNVSENNGFKIFHEREGNNAKK